MPSISVPTGSTSSITLGFASTATASLASNLLASVYAAVTANSLDVYPQPTVSGAVNEFVVTVGGAVTVPAGYNVIVDAVTTGTPTITGNGGSEELFIAGDSSFDYIPTGGSGTILSGAGNDTLVNPAFETGSGYTVQGDGSFTTVGTSTLVETISNTGTFTYSQTPQFPQTDYVITNTAPGPTTVNLNAYAETVSALSNGGVYNDNGYLTFINGGANTIVGSASTQAAVIYGGDDNMLITQGADTASLVFVNGAGNSSIVAGEAGGILAVDGAGGTINLSDAVYNSNGPAIIGPTGTGTPPPRTSNYLFGGTGAETLNAGQTVFSTDLVAGQAKAYAVLGFGNDVFFGGSGASTVVGGGFSSPDLYAFVNGASGGSDLIQNWGVGSGLAFLGYGAAGDAAIKAAIAAAPTNAPSISFTLPDNTQITITGVNGAAVNLNNNQLYLS
jgi:hypothetical protein